MHEIFKPTIEITMFDLMTSTRDMLPNINSLPRHRVTGARERESERAIDDIHIKF